MVMALTHSLGFLQQLEDYDAELRGELQKKQKEVRTPEREKHTESDKETNDSTLTPPSVKGSLLLHDFSS